MQIAGVELAHKLNDLENKKKFQVYFPWHLFILSAYGKHMRVYAG